MITREKVPVEGLLESYEAALMQTGYSITTKLLLIRRADLMIRQHLNEGMVYFDQSVINRYLREIDDRYFRGTMLKKLLKIYHVSSAGGFLQRKNVIKRLLILGRLLMMI